MSADLEQLRKADLMEIARAMNIPGRSRMRRAELISAISRRRQESAEETQPVGGGEPTPAAPPSPPLETLDEDLGFFRSLERNGPGREKRRRLYERLAAYVDESQRCPWRSLEGSPCGLPLVRGDRGCVLHGDTDTVDLAIPIGGHLGFDTWPQLFRHLWMGSYDIDPIGLDPVVAEMTWHVLSFLYLDYFRVEVEGIEHVPMDGPGLLVSNHGGAALPYDGMMLAISVANEAPVPRRVRPTATELFNILPWISPWFRKSGGVYASRTDVEYVLDRGHLVAVFPEGEKGFMKPVWNAYEVQRFGRGGFVSIAERTGAPIVPVAILGSEEVHPAVSVSSRLARLVRLFMPDQRVDGVAIFLNPIPFPVKWRIRFLPPVAPLDPGVEPNPLLMLERTDAIRRDIQEALDDMISTRDSLW